MRPWVKCFAKWPQSILCPPPTCLEKAIKTARDIVFGKAHFRTDFKVPILAQSRATVSRTQNYNEQNYVVCSTSKNDCDFVYLISLAEAQISDVDPCCLLDDHRWILQKATANDPIIREIVSRISKVRITRTKPGVFSR